MKDFELLQQQVTKSILARVAKKKLMKLHELLNDALNQLAQIEKDPRYAVDMGEWHYPKNDKCHVCLSGAYFAKMLSLSPGQVWKPYHNFSTYNLGLILDLLRTGDVYPAIRRFYVYDFLPAERSNFSIRNYHENRSGWWHDMNNVLFYLFINDY